jgi:pyruvate/2-oxoglutarate dehydrogenase complex dihydrolipoamide acyltransferase (E2) component
MKRVFLSLVTSLITATALAQAPATPAAEPPAAMAPAAAPVTSDRSAPAAGAEVYIISPRNGERVHSPFTVRFGLKGMGVAPAGIKFDNTGHHHLLIDTDLSDIQLDASLPATDKIKHFGKGQTETELSLPPGKHTLELLFADYVHKSFDPPLHSSKITIIVK